ncbi:DUF488 domain-containing protein [Sabulicella glaciei]|uniref:DUF488 domain-containing protein n=1 Tax=Sabulicella glaciei TaxID=2984948 RepID=A0ABT3P0Y5_9PROT|nr:DUF488 domain-containing protein [Roseococcus sp. MDT2-1-1]MCW8087848.1 DUF488 domain-containing protein [Roseococcus sp. MDT2-1-1]
MGRNDDTHPVYTVGHSTRSIEEFVDLLKAGNVQRLVDVRSIPRSRTNPQYNLDTLPDTLAERQIRHFIIPELGGRRSRVKDVAPEVNGFWENQSFHNYADYAMSKEFYRGLLQLIDLSVEAPCAIMCSEAVWWRCHRRIIADYLLVSGRTVLHLMGQGRIEVAKMTPAAVPHDGMLTYPKAA